MLKYLFTIIIVCVGNTACMMDKNFRCDYIQIGTAQVVFKSPSEGHHISILHPNGTLRRKAVAIGKLTDTLELKPGTYQLLIHSVSSSQDTVDSAVHAVSITVCNETNVEVNL